MSRFQIELNETNRDKLASLADRTGKTENELVNEAVERLFAGGTDDAQARLCEWREAATRVAGMWRDRDDMPSFEELRRSWDRGDVVTE